MNYIGTGYCQNCEKEVDVENVDCGIGPYEYWGSKGYHHDWRACCAECGDEVDDVREDDAPFWYDTPKHPRL